VKSKKTLRLEIIKLKRHESDPQFGLYVAGASAALLWVITPGFVSPTKLTQFGIDSRESAKKRRNRK
jgi:hypothetical protein